MKSQPTEGSFFIIIQLSMPWMVGGDINYELKAIKMKGGIAPSWLTIRDFFDALARSNLEEDAYNGITYTWCNN